MLWFQQSCFFFFKNFSNGHFVRVPCFHDFIT